MEAKARFEAAHSNGTILISSERSFGVKRRIFDLQITMRVTMTKKKQIRPLHGDAYMRFLEASALIGEKWPSLVKGESDSNISLSASNQRTSPKKTAATAKAFRIADGAV